MVSGSSRSRSQAYGSSTGPVGRCHVCGLVGAVGGSGSTDGASGDSLMAGAHRTRGPSAPLPWPVSMRVWIDQDLCTGDGLCVDHCPDVFVLLEDGISYVVDSGYVCHDPGGPEETAA